MGKLLTTVTVSGLLVSGVEPEVGAVYVAVNIGPAGKGLRKGWEPEVTIES